MTTYTDHGLACLDDEDYAAVALAMQHDALATEAALDAVSDAFDTYQMRPYATAILTTPNGPVASGGETIFGLVGWTVGANNIPGIITAGTSGMRITVTKTGWYRAHAYANIVAAGAVTANSHRTLYIRATRRIFTSPTILDDTGWRTADTNTGGEYLTVCGNGFYLVAGQTVDVEAFWSHTNLASNVSVPAGARIDCYFLGSGVVIGSA